MICVLLAFVSPSAEGAVVAVCAAVGLGGGGEGRGGVEDLGDELLESLEEVIGDGAHVVEGQTFQAQLG